MGRATGRSLVVMIVTAMLVGACGNDHRLDAPPGPNEVLACSALAIVKNRCVQCHGDPPRKGAPMPLISLDDLRQESAIHLGTSVVQRSLVRMQATSRRMPPIVEPQVPAEEIAALQAWTDAGMPACPDDDATHPEADPNMIPQDQLFVCKPNTASASPARVRRLDAVEWRWALPNYADSQNVSLARVNPLTANTADRYTTYASNETVDDVVLDLMLEPSLLGGSVGKDIVSHLTAFKATPDGAHLACIFTTALPAPACVTDFVATLLEKTVLFRTPTPDEVTRLVAFATSIITKETAIAQRPASLEQVANTAWLSTGALFRTEVGGAPEADGRRPLTADELAHALAYVISDRAPGAPRQAYNSGGRVFSADASFDGYLADIATAERDGSIQDPAVLDALLRQYAAGTDLDRVDLTPDLGNVESRRTHGEYWTNDKIRGFFREWLGYTSFPTVFKDNPAKTSKFQPDAAMAMSIYSPISTSYDQLQRGYYAVSRPGLPGSYKESLMVDQLDDVIARVVVDDHDVLKALLTTTTFHLDAQYDVFSAVQQTQAPYNLDVRVPDTREGRWVTLPPTERAGVLTHPAWLAAHGGNFDDDPSAIHRGKWIRENLLCQYVPPLSAVQGVQAMVGPSEATKTARSRIQDATNDELCQGCHRLMNPLGFAFETYNHAGFVRVKDHDGSAPNGSMVLEDTPDPGLDGSYASAIDLNRALADSGFVKRCFIRQAFRYYMGRAETRADACTLEQMETAYDAKGSFLDLLAALVTSDTFRYVRIQEDN